MTDEAPTAAEIEALIARLREAAKADGFLSWRDALSAAAALAAMQARIAERDKLLRRVLEELDESPRDGISDELSVAIRESKPTGS